MSTDEAEKQADTGLSEHAEETEAGNMSSVSKEDTKLTEADSAHAQAPDSSESKGDAAEVDEGGIPVDETVIDKLADGFLQKFLPPLEAARMSLEGVLSNQQVQIETIQQENAKFRECTAMEDLALTMAKAKKYYGKLISLRKEMTALHEKSAKLKKRALKIQQQRHKEELHRAQQREKELEHERMLSATLAKNTNQPS